MSAYSILAAGMAAGDAAGASVTLDTRGADLIVLAVSVYSSGVTGPTDSLGNTWTPLTDQTSGGTYARIWYCARPTVGASHTLSLTGASSFADLGYLILSGSDPSPFASESGAAADFGGSISAGVLTPPRAGCLVVSGLSASAGAGYTVSAPAAFAVADFAGGVHMGGGISWEIQGVATPRDPTWSLPGDPQSAVAAAVFLPAPVSYQTWYAGSGRGAQMGGGML